MKVNSPSLRSADGGRFDQIAARLCGLACRSIVPLTALLLAACGTQAPRPAVERAEMPPAVAKPAPAKPPAYGLRKGGGYYQDDGPGDNAPADMAAIPDAVPKAEPLSRAANRPYSALGRDYTPFTKLTPYREQGLASWYGRKYHGQRTSNGEIYDMYGMTAAHPVLPIPSYVRVTANGRSVIVRVNDRGPFHPGRIIDLSYTAAWKLGLVNDGSGLVEVESILPGTLPPPPVRPDPIEGFAKSEAEPEPAPLPETREASGHYLQLGAFGNRDNAEALRARLARELGELGDRLAVHSDGGLYRLQLGPWADAQEARQAALRVGELLDMRPVVVRR